MTPEYRPYQLVGGPRDGLYVEANGAAEIRFPVMQPLTVGGPKVVPFRRGPRLSYDVVTYYRVGTVYRWEGLIEDAWCDLDVSDELLVDGGPLIRKEVRYQMRHTLENLAKDKELGRIVWRVVDMRHHGMKTFRAIVGPRRVERGLIERTLRQHGYPNG